MAEQKTKLEQLQEAVLTIQLQREQMEFEKLQREEAEFARRQHEAKQARLIGSEALLKQAEKDKITQQQCPHIKPNAQSAIGGQWDHHGKYHWICAYCAKEWQDNDLPLHLRIDMNKVGGPQR